MLKVTRISLLSGVTRTMELPITQEQLDLYEACRGLVQNIFPNLTASQREFIMTGITDEEWDSMCEE